MRKFGFVMAGIALAVGLLTGCGGQRDDKVLNIYIWTEYLPDEVLKTFTERTGIKVNYDTFDSPEAILDKLSSGVADYDIVCPSDYMDAILIKEGLLQPLDKSKLPNLANQSPLFMDQSFDPGNQYSIPYLWGTTGVAYNKKKLGFEPDSWKVMFDPKHASRILMLDDMRECFAAALSLLGRSHNETDPAKIAEAAALLKQQKPIVQTYNSSDFANLLAAGDVDLAHGYNGEFARVIAENPDLGYMIPKEGGTKWMDNLAIPKTARNVEAAHLFLNYIMEPEIMAKVVNEKHYAAANEAAKAFINPEILNNPVIYPPDAALEPCEFLIDIGDAVTAMDKLWTEIKAQ